MNNGGNGARILHKMWYVCNEVYDSLEKDQIRMEAIFHFQNQSDNSLFYFGEVLRNLSVVDRHLEDACWQLFAEHPKKIQVLTHQILLDIL